MKPILRYITLSLIVFLLAACKDSKKEDEPTPAPVPSGDDKELPEGQITDCMLLVYMLADNSLGDGLLDTDDLEEMKAVAHEVCAGGNRVLIYHDARREAPVLKELKSDGTFTCLKTYDYNSDIFSVDTERMERVIHDCRRVAPARHYGLVLWSHGSGWDNNATRAPAARSYGEDRGRRMKVTSLASVLEGKNHDFIYFDCCFMATVEVAYELRNCARYIAGSVTQLPALGMPYDQNLPLLLSTEPDVVGAARNTFNLYDSKSGNERWCTMSVVDCSKLDRLAAATRNIMSTAPESPLRSAVQNYAYGATCTVFDLADYIAQMDCDPQLADEFRLALDDCVIYNASTPFIYEDNRFSRTITIRTHCGLSTYILQTPDDSSYLGYNTLSWWKDVVSHNPRFQTQQQ